MGLGQGDLVLRDQFILGLKEGPVRQELRRQVRKAPQLTFDEVKMEALALEDEQGQQWPAFECTAVPLQTSWAGFIGSPATAGQVSGPLPSDPAYNGLRVKLTGDCPLVDVRVDGINVKCLLDTGSQVTLFSESVCNELFRSKQVRNSDEIPWLTLRAANGLNLPWVGYMVADFEIHGVRVPARGIVVPKDECIGADKAILGMNVITDCWEELFTQYKASPKHSMPPLSREWNTVFIDCQRIRAASNAEPWQATARLASRTPVTIPAQSEMTVWAKIPRPSSNQPGCALVEPLGEDGGVGVARALVTVRKARIPVRVRNVHPYALTLSRFQRLATVLAVDPDAVRDGKELSILNVGPGVVEVNLVDTADPDKPEGNETTNALPLSKGDGLTDDEQRQLNELLRRWSHVFSTHEEDYEQTGAVKHRIPTGDSNPIRERLPAPPDRELAGEERLVGAVETMSMDSPPNSWRWDPERWRSLQNEDPDLQSIKEHVERGYAPAFLMFGRHMRTPVDLLTGGFSPKAPMDATDWVTRHQQQLTYAYEKTSRSLQNAGSTPNAQIIVCVLKEEMALNESSIATT
uniref:Peptidase A2 domain-containing protein n=1 Tax=Knipowitschia caucasica TaxID=637954 RepID=A0AAV2KUJ1_KNICA